MIDIHSHILPGIDDGSTDLQQSLESLKKIAESGTRRLYLTSHFFKGHYEYSRAEYDKRFNELKSAMEAAGISLELKPGFEVFLQMGAWEDIRRESLFLGDSRYVLFESDLNGLPPDLYGTIYPVLRMGAKPILAHAERYVSIMKRPSEIKNLISRNVYVQVNAASFMGYYGAKVKDTAYRLLEEGWVHFIASDDHARGNYDTFPNAFTWIEEHLDRRTAELLMQEFPSRIESGEDIPYTYVKVMHHHRSHSRKKKSFLAKIFG